MTNTPNKPIVATWRGRGVVPAGRKVIIPAELDGDSTKLVTLSVPLSKVDTLVASLYRARKAAIGEAETERALIAGEDEPQLNLTVPADGSDFMTWLINKAREYDSEKNGKEP